MALKEREIQNFIMQFIHHGSLTSASICHDYCYTIALHVMESLHMESYVHNGTVTIFSSGQVVQGAKKWFVWFLALFSRKLPHTHKFILSSFFFFFLYWELVFRRTYCIRLCQGLWRFCGRKNGLVTFLWLVSCWWSLMVLPCIRCSELNKQFNYVADIFIAFYST